MKVYPKVPRYDHPVVPADFFETDDLTLVEKFDGSSFRFTLYEERFADRYPESVENAAGDPRESPRPARRDRRRASPGS